MTDKRLSAEERKIAIAIAAMPIFAEKGFNSTTTKDLAVAAGVSEALLYKHFPSKEALYENIQSICCQKISEKADDICHLEPSTSTLVSAIYLLTHGIVQGHDSEQETHNILKRMLIHSLTEDGKFAKQFLEARMTPWLPVFVECIEAASQAGDIEDGPILPNIKVWLAHHIAVGINIFTLTKEPVIDYGMDKEELVKQATWFVLRGIGLKNEAIKAHYNPQAFALMMKS